MLKKNSSAMSRPAAVLILALTALPPTARAADRAADLAATIAARVLAVERRLGGAETRANVLETVVLNVERLPDRHMRRRNKAAKPIGEGELRQKMPRLGRGCAALRRLGTDPSFMAGMNEDLCRYLLRVLTVDEQAAASLPASRLGELRYDAVMPTQRHQDAAEGWDLFLEYIRRQGTERAGSEGAVWAAPKGREDAFAARVTEILRGRGEAVWRRAMEISGPEDVWITAAAMEAALDDLLPAGRRGGEVYFLPRSGPPLVCPPWTAEAVRRSRGPWRETGRLLDPKTSLDLTPLSPQAAEDLVERATALASASLERGSAAWEGGLLSAPPEAPSSPPLFREIRAESSGLEMPPREAPRDSRMSDQMPGGMAVLDYDGDGRPDLFICDSDQARLYRNLGGFRLQDVTAEAGLTGAVCRTGASSADYDNDGRPDLLLLHDKEGRDHLWHNDGGRFHDATEEVGLSTAPAQTASAVWLDYDGDGRLDLYLVEYRDFAFMDGGPTENDARNGLPNRLYHNVGGRFVDVSTSAGVADTGWGLAAAAFDAFGDGRPALLVINDFGHVVLYRNLGDGTFADVTSAAGLPAAGNGMGVSVADYDGDGRPDLYLTYIGDANPKTRPLFPGAHPRVRTELKRMPPESNRLYRGRGDGTFEDRGADMDAIPTGWGWNGMFLDAANSGHQDIFLVNGWWPHRHFYDADTKAFLRWDPEARRFRDSSAVSGLDFAGNSRVSVYEDFDGDGCLDVVVTGFHAPRLFAGQCPKSNHWLELRLEGSRSNRDGIGARATVRAGGRAQTAELGPQGGGFENSLRRVLRFGLGPAARFESVEVAWPSGIRQTVGPGDADRVLHVREAQTR